MVFGLNINLLKSSLLVVEVYQSEVISSVSIFGCVVVSFPLSYLGIPVDGPMTHLRS